MSDEQKLAGGFTSLLRDIFDSSGSPDSQAVPGGLHYPPFRRGKAGGQDRAPAPWGEKCFFTVTHQCAAFGGRGSSFGEWELLCYFLFTGFLLAVFSHLGDNGFKSQSTVILWLEHFSSSPPPPPTFPVEHWKFGVYRRNWKMEKGKRGRENLFWAGRGYPQDTPILHPRIQLVQRVYWH